MNAISGTGMEVGRAEHLAQVPLGMGFRLELLLGELLGAVGEVPAEDHHVGPVVADQVRHRVGAEGALPVPGPVNAGKTI